MAGTHEFEVADEAGARSLAAALADFGFPYAAAWPLPSGPRWRVAALDEGPYPVDRLGHRQFAAMAHAAARIARRHGGYPLGSGQFDVSMLPHVVPERPVSVRNPGSRPPAPAIVLAERPPEAELPFEPDQLTLVRADLSGLDEVPWATLSHAHGAATDVPDLIRALTGRAHWHETLNELLADDLLHQGSCYSATAPAIPFLVELTGSLDVHRRVYLYLDLMLCAKQWCDRLVWDVPQAHAQRRLPRVDRWTTEVSEAVGETVSRLLARWDDEPPAARFVLAGLAGLFPHHGHLVAERVETVAAALAGTAQGACLDLAAALARRGDHDTLQRAAEIVTWLDDLRYLDVGAVTGTVPAAVVGGKVLANAMLRCTPEPGRT